MFHPEIGERILGPFLGICHGMWHLCDLVGKWWSISGKDLKNWEVSMYLKKFESTIPIGIWGRGFLHFEEPFCKAFKDFGGGYIPANP